MDQQSFTISINQNVCFLLEFPSLIKNNTSKYIEWDYKTNSIKPNVENYTEKSKIINETLKWVTDIIESKFTQEETIITGKELLQLLSNNYQVNQTLKSSKIREHYEWFWGLKKKNFSKKPQSLKDYTSLKNLLESFELYHNKTILIRTFNKSFLDEFISLMVMKHPKELERNGKLYKLKTKGQLVSGTIRKRLDCLKEFKNKLVENNILPQNDFIEKKRSGIKPNEKKKVTLTIKEINSLYKIDFNNKKLNETKDLFVFICFTGLRWSDLSIFDPRFIIKNNQDWIYEFTPVKTEDSSSIDCYIPLCSKVKEILIRYDYDLKSIIKSNQDFNESLKKVCKKSNLFNSVTKTKEKDSGNNKHRYELITAHKGRDTFITNLIDSTPINELMKYTGHSKVSTLMKYVDKSRKVSNQYIKIFD